MNQSEAEIEARDDLLEQAIDRIEVRSPQGSLTERTLEAAGNALGTADSKLRFLDGVCNLCTGLTLLKIFVSNYRVADYFPDGVLNMSGWERYLSEHGSATALLLVIIGVYYLSRRCVKTELAIARQLFPPSRSPREFEGIGSVVMAVIIYTLTFIVMALFADYIWVAAAGFLVIFCINLYQQVMTRIKLRNYFEDPNLKPAKTDEHEEFIMRRRRVAWTYFFDRPHRSKEAVVILGCVISLVVSALAHAQASRTLAVGAVAILIVTLVGNEAVAFRWRSVRSRALKSIDDDQSIADEARVLGR